MKIVIETKSETPLKERLAARKEAARLALSKKQDEIVRSKAVRTIRKEVKDAVADLDPATQIRIVEAAERAKAAKARAVESFSNS